MRVPSGDRHGTLLACFAKRGAITSESERQPGRAGDEPTG
jgi:hypothetical protein